MPEVEGDQLRQAVESQHGGKATLMLKVPVKETFGGVPAWEGAVHIFALTDHPTAMRAFAWSSPIEGSTERRFFVVLQIPPVTSPALAVRAAIMAERRSGGSHEPKRDKPRNGE